MTSRRRAVALLVLFVATLLVLPVQLYVAHRWSEPYPAIFLPAFHGSPEDAGTSTINVPTVEARLASGGVTTLDVADILPEDGAGGTSLLRTVFDDPQRAQDPRTREWLTERLSLVSSDDPVVQVSIRWDEVTVDISSQQVLETVPEKSVVVDLDGTP